ncbi:MAG: amino acid permease [Candidatus Omnitrophica bacterium]|nr:amino acid permease [Candidatus Omnitrophota bacterium]
MTTKSKVVSMSVFAMAMMTSAAIMSLRGLPMIAKEEFTLFFYIGFATIMFLIPGALVAAELGGMFGEKEGGVYTWVKEAFGERFGFVAIWLQWVQNVVWYPTPLAFAAATFAYIIGAGSLASNGIYTGLFCIVFYWLATWLSVRNSSSITRITSYGFLIGTILPALILVALAIVWWMHGFPLGFAHLPASQGALGSVINNHVHPRLFPHITGLSDIAFLAGVILLFAGVEVHAVHANRMSRPQIQYPLALLLTSVIVFVIFTLGAFAVAAIMPYNDINLESGLIQAFQKALSQMHMSWCIPLVGILVMFGALASVTSWIVGPSRGLLQTAKDGLLPIFMAKTNQQGVQSNILLVQAVIVTFLSCVYFVFKNVSVAFFLIGAMTITLYLIMYMFMYAAGIRLRYKRADMPRRFRVPGGMAGMWFMGLLGLVGVIFSFIVAFFPPSQLPVGNPAMYVLLVSGGTVFFTAIPFFMKGSKAAAKVP